MKREKIMANAALVSTVISAGAGAVAFATNNVLEASFNEVSIGTIDQFFHRYDRNEWLYICQFN